MNVVILNLMIPVTIGFSIGMMMWFAFGLIRKIRSLYPSTENMSTE